LKALASAFLSLDMIRSEDNGNPDGFRSVS
jgi:hypothetical protein